MCAKPISQFHTCIYKIQLAYTLENNRNCMISSKKAAAHMREKHGGLFSIKDVQKGMVDFSSNILPGGPPPKVAKAMRSALAEAAKYPDPVFK